MAGIKGGGNPRWRKFKVAGEMDEENLEVGENLRLCEFLGRVTHRVFWCKEQGGSLDLTGGRFPCLSPKAGGSIVGCQLWEVEFYSSQESEDGIGLPC